MARTTAALTFGAACVLLLVVLASGPAGARRLLQSGAGDVFSGRARIQQPQTNCGPTAAISPLVNVGGPTGSALTVNTAFGYRLPSGRTRAGTTSSSSSNAADGASVQAGVRWTTRQGVSFGGTLLHTLSWMG